MSRDFTWWRGPDLNLRPSGYEPYELRVFQSVLNGPTDPTRHRSVVSFGKSMNPLKGLGSESHWHDLGQI